jgi:hypothetical protein
VASGTLQPFPFHLFLRNLTKPNKKYKPFSGWNLSTVKTASKLIITHCEGERTTKKREKESFDSLLATTISRTAGNLMKIIPIWIIFFEIGNRFRQLIMMWTHFMIWSSYEPLRSYTYLLNKRSHIKYAYHSQQIQIISHSKIKTWFTGVKMVV